MVEESRTDMSISSIVASSLFQPTVTQGVQNKFQKIQSEFQQLGQDLKAGDLSGAQKDFATLIQDLPISQTQGGASSGGAAQALQVLGQDLQSGNLAAAQGDFAAIQRKAQERGQAQLHRHHHDGQNGVVAGSQISAVKQDFSALGVALQGADVPSAQRAYSALQSALQQALPELTGSRSGASVANLGLSSSSSVNLNA